MTSPFTNLVIGAAGSKNIATIGALEVLEPYLCKIKRLLGVSSGSILVTLISVGCNYTEIKAYYNSVDFSQFKIQYYNPITYFNIIKNGGINNSSKFRKIIQKILKNKTGISDITFKQIYERYGKELVIPVCCVNKREMFYYNYISNPDMPVANAIEQSCCVPGVFFPIKYKNDTIVDGGIIDGFPIYYFNDEESLPNSKIQQINQNSRIANPKTIGILIIDPTVSKDPNDPYLGDDDTSTFFGYTIGILNTLLTTNSRCRIGLQYWESIIAINIGKKMDGVTNMTIPEDVKEDLIQKGRQAANEFLNSKIV